MEGISLDNRILQQILQCFIESQNPFTNQFFIYQQLQNIVENVPNFFCYLIHILISNLQSESNNILYSQLSIICIRRYFKCIKQDQIIFFLSKIIPVLINIISNHINPLISHSTILLTNLVEYYGEQIVPNFDSILATLISGQNTIAAALDAMVDITQSECNYKIKIQHLQYLITIFSNIPGSDLTSTFLLIILNLMRSSSSNLYLPFITTEILKFININHSNFQSASLLYSMCIVTNFYESTGDPNLGDFIAFCIHTLGELASEGLQNFSEEVPFHAGLVASLFECLQFEEGSDDNGEIFGLSDLAQEIIQNMASQHKSVVVNIVIQMITKSQNPSQILKGLYSICDELENTDNFVQFALQHLHDDSRGYAALFLSQVSNSENSKHIVSALIPLVLDQNERVREKVLSSLEDIFECDYEFLDIDVNWVPPLFQAFIVFVRSDDSHSASKLSRQIFCILERVENLPQIELFQSFFKFVYEVFFSDEKLPFLHACSVLLEILLKKLNVTFSKEIEAIVHRVSFVMRNPEIAFFCHEQFCYLLLTLVLLYGQNVARMLGESLSLIAEQFATGADDRNFFWRLVTSSLRLAPQLIENAELAKTCVRLALESFAQAVVMESATVDLVSLFLCFVVRSLDEATVERLFKATVELVSARMEEAAELRNTVELLRLIVEYKAERKSATQEHVMFYKAVASKLSET